MALFKEIRQDDGVTTKYHRILYMNQTVNSHNSIVVISYVDKESRLTDKVCENRPYRQVATYETDYDETMTIKLAYEYLKTLLKFKDSEDV